MKQMAVANSVRISYLPSKRSRRHHTTITATARFKPPPPSLHVSTSPSHVDLEHLRGLYASCNHSCHRFPPAETAAAIDPTKLAIAVSNSYIVVSVFARLLDDDAELGRNIGGWKVGNLRPVTPWNGRLVGFGRAVSDVGLTAAIYDVMVLPSMQGRGIGRMIVQRIVRMLTNKGIYDISALCSEEERPFFRACGFGDDVLKSTTMMYTRAPSKHDEVQAIYAGRKLLLIPSSRKL